MRSLLLLRLLLPANEGSGNDNELSSSTCAALMFKVVSVEVASSCALSDRASALEVPPVWRWLRRGDGAGEIHGEIAASTLALVPMPP